MPSAARIWTIYNPRMPAMSRSQEDASMTQVQRLVLAVAIVLADTVIFFLPLAALFIAYVILMNPPWVRAFMDRLDGPAD